MSNLPAIVLEGQPWHYGTWGSPQHPLLLLLHGFTGSNASWKTLGERWAARYYVVAPDLPGHGHTPPQSHPQEMSMAQTARRISLFLSYLSSAKATVLGYSMGGRLALHVGATYGDQVSKLILESASPGLAGPEEQKVRREQDQALADTIEAKGLAWFIDYWAQVPLFKSQPQELKRRENETRATHTAFGLAQSLRGAGTGEQDSLWEALPKLKVPTLLVTGKLDTKFRAIAEKMARHIPKAIWVEIEKAGHNVHGECPDQFFDCVNQFLAGPLGDQEGDTHHGI